MKTRAGPINIELGYARQDEQILMSLTLDEGITVEEAIRESGVLQRFTEIDLERNTVGIFGARCPLDRVLREGDRIEIYRPLCTDPKIARRRRAEKSTSNRAC